VQLNALCCCIWRNVNASCHKHFVVFSPNQHRRLCVKLARWWRWSTGDRVYITWPVAASTQAVKPDIGSELRFLHIPPAFDAPVRGEGFCRNIAIPFGTEKLMVWLPDGEKISKISLFILTECTNVSDTRTDTQTDTA